MRALGGEGGQGNEKRLTHTKLWHNKRQTRNCFWTEISQILSAFLFKRKITALLIIHIMMS